MIWLISVLSLVGFLLGVGLGTVAFLCYLDKYGADKDAANKRTCPVCGRVRYQNLEVRQPPKRHATKFKKWWPHGKHSS